MGSGRRWWPPSRRILGFGALVAALSSRWPALAQPDACAAAELREIEFQVPSDPPDPEYPISDWISLEDAQKEVARLKDADRRVLPCAEIVVVVDYPVMGEFTFPLKSAGGSGFTRAELVLGIADIYRRVYEEETKTTRTPVIPPEKRRGVLNRNATDGTYGIWGHDLGDLVLNKVIPERRDGMVYVTLQIWS